EAEDEAGEADRREDAGEDVERDAPGLGDVADQHRSGHECQHTDGQHGPEHPAPAEHVEHQATHGGADGRGDGDHDGDDSHGAAATVGGHHVEHGGHEQRDHDGGADRLDDTAGDEHG